MINILYLLIFGGMILTASLIWVLFDYAGRWGLLDCADADRKKHIGEIPLIGGIAIFFCLQIFQFISPSFPLALSAAMLILVVVGFIDDRSHLRALPKLLFQCLAVTVLIFGADVKIVSLGTLPSGAEILLGYFSIPITLICAVGLINAMNMIDGMDGLAASLSLFALVYLFFAAVLVNKAIDPSTLKASAILAGALLGFLLFNFEIFPSKKIFLGDAGSMLLGLFLAFVLIQTSQRPPLISALPASIVPWVVAVPVLDTIVVTTRRMLRGKSPMRADRTHLHHRLLDFGFSPQQTLVFILTLSLAVFALGLVLNSFGGVHAGFGFLCLLSIYFISVFRLNRTHPEV